MTIKILRGKVLETDSIYKAEIDHLASLAEKEPIEAELSENYFILSRPYREITKIRSDFVSIVQS